MLNYINKLKRFSGRNRKNFLSALSRHYLATAYCKPFVRKISRPFFSVKTPKKWIFLVGCYNSGTTIYREMLGAHPEISTLPREGVRFTTLLPRPEDKGWERMWIGCPEHMEMPEGKQIKSYQQIVKEWSPWWSKDASAYLEKSITNTTRMKWLDDNFENAYFLGITRNGYCASEGIRRRAKPSGEACEVVGVDYPLEMVGKQWVDASERLIEGAASVSRYYEVSYEDLSENPLEALKDIFQFLEIEATEISLEENVLNIYGKEFSLQNMNDKSMRRLSKMDIQKLAPVISDMLLKKGYSPISASNND